VLRAAAENPTTLTIGLDAVADPMAEASRRAARRPARGGLPNALFVVAAIELPPPELIGRADLVSVSYPWGSLLAAVLAVDPAAMAGLTSLVRPGGTIEAVMALTARDHRPELAAALADRDRLAVAWARLGFELQTFALVDRSEAIATGSSWARRLAVGSPDDRPVVRVRFMRVP
jgi:16S rRNA (adenine(1408)-N(1))-methyltransferase